VDSAGAAVRSVNDRRATASVGRDARLELVFGCRDGRTLLKHAYAEPPFRAGRCFGGRDGVHFIMAWSAPGVFGGDSLTQQIVVERGARVRLTSQSALQAHRSPDGQTARISSTYHVEDGAELRCEWDPLIPFAGARLEQRIDIGLAGRAGLLWSDAFMNGREGSGERWAFAALSHELKVARDASLEYVERYRLSPQEHRAERAWVAGDACYFGTVLCSGPAVDPERTACLHEALEQVADVRSAADRLDAGLVLVRLMAEAGVPFREARALATRSLAPPDRA
jgi:urease accessory protein